MSSIKLIKGSCADQEVDAVVNAANRGLYAGGGICGVIFNKAGMRELTYECRKHKTPLKDGEAVITSACKMTNCKYIIHAVGPTDGNAGKLKGAFYNSLIIADSNNLKTIGMVPISSGIFGSATAFFPVSAAAFPAIPSVVKPMIFCFVQSEKYKLAGSSRLTMPNGCMFRSILLTVFIWSFSSSARKRFALSSLYCS